MQKLLGNSWTMFFGLLLGLFLLMISLRPGLQGDPGGEGGPAKKIAIAGHVLTWTSAGVLGLRMVRNIREHGTTEEVSKPPADPPVV